MLSTAMDAKNAEKCKTEKIKSLLTAKIAKNAKKSKNA